MNVKTMEGLAGAGASIRMIATPMSVAKEAESKGDTEKQKRALGYAAGVIDQAESYGEKARQGMKLDAREAKKQEKLRQEELMKARKEEREEQEKRTEAEGENRTDTSFDSVEISEEGKYQAKLADTSSLVPADISESTGYHESGEAADSAAETGTYVDVIA